MTIQNTDINDGTVSKANGNLISTGTFDAPLAEGDSAAYDEYVKWENQWNSKLKKQEVNVYLPTDIALAIADAYEQKHRSHQAAQWLPNGNYKLPGHAKRTFIPMDDLKGTRIFATIPGNILLGVNNESDESFVNVVPEPSQDTKDMVMQIQGLFGAMIVDVNARSFVTNGGTIEMSFNSGDYQKDAVTVVANDAELGEVAISNNGTAVESGEEVAKGTTLTLTATPKDGAEFVKWSNGSTQNPTSVVTTGDPMGIVAIFKANA